MSMASHVIDSMVLDIAFDADAGLRDDEWRSYLSAKLLPAVESVLDRHVHRDGVLVLPEVELDLGDIPFDGFQEEMTRRIERQLTDLLQHREAQLAGGGREQAGQVALVPHTRRAIARLADFLTNGVLTAQEDIADAGSHQRLLEQVLDANPAGLHALLRLSARRQQAVARLTAQFPASALQRLARTLQADADVALMIERLLDQAGQPSDQPFPPASRESRRLQLWQKAIDAMLDGLDVRKALANAAAMDVAPSGAAASMDTGNGAAKDGATGRAAGISPDRPIKDFSLRAHPAMPHDESAENGDALRPADRQLLQVCATGDAATLARFLEEGRNDAIRSALHAIAGTRQIAERMAESMPPSLLAELIALLHPEAGNFLRALRKELSGRHPRKPSEMQSNVLRNRHGNASEAQRRFGADMPDAADERDWSRLQRQLTAALFLSVLDAAKAPDPLSAAIRRARQEWESIAERWSPSPGQAETAAGRAASPAYRAESLPGIIESMSRLPDAASAALREAFPDSVAWHAASASSGTPFSEGRAEPDSSAIMQRHRAPAEAAAEKPEAGTGAALEYECWQLALAVLLERERLAAESAEDERAAVFSAESHRSLQANAGAGADSTMERPIEPVAVLPSSSPSKQAVPPSRAAAVDPMEGSSDDSAGLRVRILGADGHAFLPGGAAPSGETPAAANMPSAGNRMHNGRDIARNDDVPRSAPESKPKEELNDRAHSSAEETRSRGGLQAAGNAQRGNGQQTVPAAGMRQPRGAAESSPARPGPASKPADAKTGANGNAVAPDIAAIVDSLIRIADAWQNADPASSRAAESAHDVSTSIETETSLRHRLARALLTGDASGLEGDWPMLLRRQSEMVVQAVRHYMQMAGVGERMARRFPEAMLADLLALLEPQAAALHAEQQKRLHFLTGKEGAAARRSLWESAWRQLPTAAQAFDAAAYANTLAQRTDAILRNAAAETGQRAASENAALEQAYRRYQHVHDALLGKVAMTPQAAADVDILRQDFPVLLRQLIRALRSASPSMAQLVYDEGLYAVLLPQAIADGDAPLSIAQAAFLEAIFSHAGHAADPFAYYRGVLAALLREEPVDLDALAAPEERGAPHMAGSDVTAAQKHAETHPGNADERHLPEAAAGNGKRPAGDGKHAAASAAEEDIRRTPGLFASSSLYLMLSAPDRADAEALQQLIRETAEASPEAMQPVWDALRTKKLPGEGQTFTRGTWRSFLMAWMRNRFSAERVASVLAALDRDTKSANGSGDRYRTALLDMLAMHRDGAVHAQAGAAEASASSAMPAGAFREQPEKRHEAAPWQADAWNVLLTKAHDDAEAKQALQRWLRTGLSSHLPAMRAALHAMLRDRRMAGLFAAEMPEALLASALAAIDARHAFKRFQADCVEDAFLAIDHAAPLRRLRAAKWQHLLHRAATGAGEGDRAQYAADLARHLIDEIGTARAEEVLAAVRRPMPAISSPGTSETDFANVADSGNGVRRTAASTSTQAPSAHAALPRTDAGTGDAVSRSAADSDRQVVEESPRSLAEREIHVANAGMVLAAPYITHLFALLKLTEQGRFVDPKAAERAVHLLQFMVDKRTATPEYQLVLNKLLCGVKTGTPIVAGIDITDHERETVESLLQGMIVNWGALGSTSIDGLRVSFLQRPGWLRRQEDGWHLQVEKRAYDMLLDRLPWSFSMIRHGWMPALLRVDWR